MNVILSQWKAGEKVSEKEVAIFGKEKCFVSEEISDSIFCIMKGKSYKKNCNISRCDLRYIKVLHKNLQGETILGEMVCNKAIASDLLDIFRELYDAGYPIERMVLIDNYNAPLYNPYVKRKADGTVWISPECASSYVNRKKKFNYKISGKDLCVKLFKRHGFSWGGDWKSLKDYQHFEK